MNLDIKNIDFDNIKLNLINFLKNQSKFSGYNFEGSSLNVLMDLLAYNTYYQMFYNNMTFNEMFLDSAVKRSSVVSLARNIGYTPSSVKSSRSIVQVALQDSAAHTIIADDLLIPKHTIFRSTKDSESVNFYTTEDIYLYDTGSRAFTSNNIELVQGELFTNSFIHDVNYPFKKYILVSDNIDISTITVSIQNSETDTSGQYDNWEQAKDITKITENSLVYFVEENADGFYQIHFGDGVLGKKLNDGNKITCSYLVARPDSNGIGFNGSVSTFSCDKYASISNTITTVRSSYGGAEQETIESIRNKAPKSFTTQERAVTVDDYAAILMKQFPNIKDVNCWGGEDNDPPEYGKIFICIKPKNGETLSFNEKQDISNTLKRDRAVVGITSIFEDPEYTYLNTTSNIQVNPAKLKISKSALNSKIQTSIQNYINTTIDVFNGDFYLNELIPVIDAIDESIKGVTVGVVLEKRFIPIFTQFTNYSIKFKNPLRKTTCEEVTINSTPFLYTDKYNVTRTCQFKNGSDNNLDIVYINDLGEIITVTTIGLINYISGEITITNFQPISLVNSDILKIYALPDSANIFAEKNNVLRVDEFSADAIKINITEVSYRANL